jgi:hypothetical protein
MISKLLKQIRRKRQNAKQAGLEIISTEKLALIALASPHWRNMGNGKEQFNFCRRDHSKGYTEENTFIGSSEENIRERLQRCGLPRGESLAALSPAERKQRVAGQQKAYYKRTFAARAAYRRAYRLANREHINKLARDRRKRKAVAAGNCNGSRNPT